MKYDLYFMKVPSHINDIIMYNYVYSVWVHILYSIKVRVLQTVSYNTKQAKLLARLLVKLVSVLLSELNTNK